MLIRAVLFSVLLAVQPLGWLPAAALPQRPPANQKVIKDPAEYNAYMAALNTPNPAQKAAAMEAFVRNYPDSVVKIDALEHAMAAYQQAGNTQKVEEIARRILDTEPYNPRALAIITFIDRGKAASGDTVALQESCADARKGLTALSRFASRPDLAAEGEGRKLRAQMATIFFGAAGFCALQAKDYSTARDNFSRALQINPDNMQDNYQIGIADLEMTPLDVNGFWYLAKAINLAQGNASAKDGMASYARAKYGSYHGSDSGWDQIVTQAANQNAVPSGFTVEKKSTPAELAILAVQKNDPASLSFSDWEFVLGFRDASAANKDAADKVWQAISDKEKNGQAKLKLPVKVIASTKYAIQAALTEDNQQANKADLQASMEKPMEHPPAPGTNIDLMGVITGYTPQPFMFAMNKAEIYKPQPAPALLSEADIEELLRGGVSAKRATELVKQKGVDFALDASNEAKLRKAGATDELLLAIAVSKK
jgi:tetratricopeptide (TPR) repeat protein